jgi:hypothetical protein
LRLHGIKADGIRSYCTYLRNLSGTYSMVVNGAANAHSKRGSEKQHSVKTVNLVS